MAPAVPYEQRLLRLVEARLDVALADRRDDHAARLEVLEAVAALHGGFDLGGYRSLARRSWSLSEEEALERAAGVLPELRRLAIPIPLALTALAREPLPTPAQRRAGAYYTDFRLAQRLAGNLVAPLEAGQPVIDPASGTGILLVALAMRFAPDQAKIDRFLRDSVYAADLSENALRGAALALASMTSDLDVVERFLPRLRVMDSLRAGPQAWNDVAPRGFAAVIANPPWEKLKISRHEHLLSEGVERHYGADYEEGAESEALDEARRRMASYVAEVSRACGSLRSGGEVDLYQLFVSLSLHLVDDGGQLALLLPAGLIRAHGTAALRRHLFNRCSVLRVGVCFNHAQFFAIDSRFKFLSVHARLGSPNGRKRPLTLEHLEGTPDGVKAASRAVLGRRQLRRIRPDLTVPEVRSQKEWSLFCRMSEAGITPATDGAWAVAIVRELDMTRDRRLFSRERRPGAVPLIEGRMVHQFRHGAKAYVSGSGRAAVWEVAAPGDGRLRPQFWVDPDELSEELRERITRVRVGFCDIAGQTNERAMLAARIPARAICGNKVPTIQFGDERRASLWLAIVNSFAFDWLLRRVLTTTVNYFVLRSVPLPDVDPASSLAQRLIGLSDSVEAAYNGQADGASLRQIADWRAEIDALVFQAYGLGVDDAATIMDDFPLLDRGQPPIEGEQRSTLTRDLVLSKMLELSGADASASLLEERVKEATRAGAVAYVPAEAARSKHTARRRGQSRSRTR